MLPDTTADSEVQRRIASLEAALAEAGVSVAHICRLADLSASTWVRWKHGARMREANWARVLQAVAVASPTVARRFGWLAGAPAAGQTPAEIAA